LEELVQILLSWAGLVVIGITREIRSLRRDVFRGHDRYAEESEGEEGQVRAVQLFILSI